MFLSIALPICSLLLVNGQLLSSQTVFSDPSKASVITPEFSKFVERALNTSNIHGISLAIVRKNGDPEFGAWGNRTEEGHAITSKTLFYLASCSKAFLATTFGILMDDFASGKNTTALPQGLTTLSWNTKVKDIMPSGSDWSLMDDWAYEKANIRDILSHVSGLPRHDYSIGPEDKVTDVVNRMKFLRPAFELRQQWSYNNLMFMLSSYIISHYTGSYTSFVKDRIFTPLNMSSTTFSPSEALHSGQMSQSWTNAGRRIPPHFTDDHIELVAGPGGIISNGEDMAKWVKTLLNFGVDPSTNATIIPRSVFDEIITAHAIIDGIPGQSINGYGLGWGRMSYQGHDTVWHSGGIPGSSTLVSFLPNDTLGIIVLINADGKAATCSTVTSRVIDDVLGLSSDSIPQQPTPPLQQTPNSSTPIPLDEYAGTYRNPGYGSLTLCDSSNLRNSSSCAQVLSDFAIIDSHVSYQVTPYQLHTEPQLFANWLRLWTTHVRLVHIPNSESGHKFNAQLTTLFTQGFGADETPFETFERGADLEEAVTEFVIEDGRVIGLAVFGAVGDMTQSRGNTVQEKAEVWFDKVDETE